MRTVEEAREEYARQLKRIGDSNVHGVVGTLGMRTDAEQRYGIASRALRRYNEPGFAKLRKRLRGG